MDNLQPAGKCLHVCPHVDCIHAHVYTITSDTAIQVLRRKKQRRECHLLVMMHSQRYFTLRWMRVKDVSEVVNTHGCIKML